MGQRRKQRGAWGCCEAKREAVGVEIEREDEGHVEDKRAADFE